MTGQFDDGYTRYQTGRSPLRKLIRGFYLRSARSLLRGATVDFGCGVGELLKTLPAGSRGLEYNQATVKHCRGRGLEVDWYDGEQDDWQLSILSEFSFQSMVISHVLEHLEAPVKILNSLLSASARLGIERVLIVVPGRAGFRIDATHRIFVDRAMLAKQEVVDGTGYSLRMTRYFPGNSRKIGDWFPHHELQALYLRSSDER
ncbi:methionine biosynthesis protein MetW [Luteimonas salinilitoris]|uniref:Methionine biosynthesis protein MetW n=1 Tax=Luteimonas salinilitoris TaxID=3237697 RepID=A0ABV4HNC5_9GAMM